MDIQEVESIYAEEDQKAEAKADETTPETKVHNLKFHE